MLSFKEARDLILLSSSRRYISKQAGLLLLEEFTSKNPAFSYDKEDHFDLDNIEEAECRYEFRIDKKDIPRLADTLNLPNVFKCPQRTVADKIEGLCMLLKRTAYPCRLNDIMRRFNRPVPEISMIINTVIDHIYDHHGHLITEWNHQILSPHKLESYTEAIHNKGAALENCFGFIDGTVCPICRPTRNQRQVYNGHKRVHALKFQSVSLPNGLIGNLYGPIEGMRHDSGMLADSGLLHNLEQHAFSSTGQPLCIYGDPAYPLRLHLQSPFRDARPTQQMKDFNKSMSAVRVSVEWVFGEVANSFKFIDFKKNLKIQLNSVGKMYVVCSLLHNAITCLYGNQTSQYFNLDPPTIEEYFS